MRLTKRHLKFRGRTRNAFFLEGKIPGDAFFLLKEVAEQINGGHGLTYTECQRVRTSAGPIVVVPSITHAGIFGAQHTTTGCYTLTELNSGRTESAVETA